MLNTISPLDGRYGQKTENLQQYFSEYALIKERVAVELKYLLALNKTDIFQSLHKEEIKKITNLLYNFSINDALKIKEIEKETNHDVKACEVFLRQELQLKNSEMIHWGLTSEDINNLAWSSLFLRFRCEAQIPMIVKVLQKLIAMAELYSDKPFPARTHGQMATPTTAGKELAVYVNRLMIYFKKLKNFVFVGKLNGATGNYSAMQVAAPHYNWIEFSNIFIKSLQFEPNQATTQIENHDAWAEYFDLTRHINNIICDLDLDFWQYLMLGYYSEKCVGHEVGSSTMPHKINPIRFENSEGNICIANALLQTFSDKLTKSRLQRDLSDSTVTRNIGVALSHSWLAYEQTLAGLERVQLNILYCTSELQKHPEVVTEAAQSILRVCQIPNAYDELKSLSRGHEFHLKDLETLGIKHKLPLFVIEQMAKLQPENYLGKAEKICMSVVNNAKKDLSTMKVVIIGEGAREAALSWKLSQEIGEENVFVLPGNSHIKNSYSLLISDFAKIKEFCDNHYVKYIIPGSETSLADGIVDYFIDTDIFVLGPSALCAKLESSKVFSKKFMLRYGVATASSFLFYSVSECRKFIDSPSLMLPCVIKYDGLAAGKGVYVCFTIDDIIFSLEKIQDSFGVDSAILLEECLQGNEFSLIVLLDGKSYQILPPAQDHKRLLDGDLGSNTGGMGACCPLPWLTTEILQHVDKDIVQPTLNGLRHENFYYKGFLYFGIMLTQTGPKLLEYNVRLGDPEAQVILPALQNSLSELIVDVKNQRLDRCLISWNQQYYTSVVFANKGYPEYIKPTNPIVGLDKLDSETKLFVANLENKNSQVFAGKGRNFCVVGSGYTLAESIDKTYNECYKILSTDLHFRKDIGLNSLKI